ncbi:hypothetical protein [uncultured Bifidobacterium sp.]|uniref:hypothetical protein n=1 Tax=uncultured Bifidobacterium sp. TaxID=165187 RepID=UPI002583F894|nr:hypothetical protein [uncultured Bifidobacterium sp.]
MRTSNTLFGRYTMSGGRFEEAEGLPLAVLSELDNYNKLIIDVAKRLYLRQHPSKRLPKGFAQEIDLRLTGVKTGCVVVNIERIGKDTLQQPLFDDADMQDDYVDQARKMTTKTIKQIKSSKDCSFIGDFPAESLNRLYKMGKTLNDDEKITLSEADNSISADIDSEWTSIVTGKDQPSIIERTIDGQVIGMRDEGDKFKYTFFIYDTHNEVTGTVDKEKWDTFYHFFDKQARAKMCSLSVVCKMNDNEIRNIVHTYNIESSLPSEFVNRLEELAGLKDGWYDVTNGIPQGKHIPDSVLARVQTFLREILTSDNFNDELIDLSIFPTIPGGIQLEWKTLDYEVSFNADDSVEAYDFDDSREDSERTFNRQDSAAAILEWLTKGDSNA